ncbi:MAG: MBL fold metallo-hydrolase [Terriglobia bacterium]
MAFRISRTAETLSIARLFIFSCMVMAAIVLLAPRPLAALGREYEVRELTPHTFVWVPDDIVDQNGDPRFPRASNVGFVITSEGVVVIGTTNNPFHAREVLYEIRQRTEIPVRLVIDLGAQGDQMLGNEVFAEQRATILSTSAALAEMRTYERGLARRMSIDPQFPARMRGIHFTLPNRTFQDQMSFNMGGEEVRVMSVNCGLPGASSGDAVVYLPAEKVLFLGDLYANNYVPEIDSCDVQRWITALGNMEKWNVVSFIPAHGNFGTKDDLAKFRGFLQWLNSSVEVSIRQGKSLAEVEDSLLPSSPLNRLARELAPRAIASVYEQLIRKRMAHVVPRGATNPPASPRGKNVPETGFIRSPRPQAENY